MTSPSKEDARREAILSSPQAKVRPRLARHIVERTALSVHEALATLDASPPEREAAEDALVEAVVREGRARAAGRKGLGR